MKITRANVSYSRERERERWRVIPAYFLAISSLLPIAKMGGEGGMVFKVAEAFRGKDTAGQSITIQLISSYYNRVSKRAIDGINSNGSHIRPFPIAARHCLPITVSHPINTNGAKRINVGAQTRPPTCAGRRLDG